MVDRIIARAKASLEVDTPQAAAGLHGWTEADANELRSIVADLGTI
jgi:hypothetical protein